MLVEISFQVKEKATCIARQKAKQMLAKWQRNYPITVYIQSIDIARLDESTKEVIFTAEVEGWEFEDSRVTALSP